MPHVDDATLHALLDGALRATEPARADAVEAHLEGCADCRARLEAAAGLRERAGSILALLEPGAIPGAAPALAPDFEPDFEDVRRRAAAAASGDGTVAGDPRPGDLQARGRRTDGRGRGGRWERVRWAPVLAWAASLVVALGIGYLIRDQVVPAAGRSEEALQATAARSGQAPADSAAPADAERAVEEPQGAESVAPGAVGAAAATDAAADLAQGAGGEPRTEESAEADEAAEAAAEMSPTDGGETRGRSGRAAERETVQDADGSSVSAATEAPVRQQAAATAAPRQLAVVPPSSAQAQRSTPAAPAAPPPPRAEESREAAATESLADDAATPGRKAEQALRPPREQPVAVTGRVAAPDGWRPITGDEARRLLDGPLYALPGARVVGLFAQQAAADPARVLTRQRLSSGELLEVTQSPRGDRAEEVLAIPRRRPDRGERAQAERAPAAPVAVVLLDDVELRVEGDLPVATLTDLARGAVPLLAEQVEVDDP